MYTCLCGELIHTCAYVCVCLTLVHFFYQKSGDQGFEDLFEDFSPDHSPTFDYFDDLGPSMNKKVRQ